MTQQNKHGLSRDIPEPTKRKVRQACAFGCVICGGSIVDYEHIDPAFEDAREHDPEKIALLCPTCHGKITRKFWSKDKVKAHRQAPRCKETGFSWGDFDFGNQHPYVHFAGQLLRNCPTPVALDSTRLFTIEGPEQPGGPFRLSATFCNSQGSQVLRIVRNEWQASVDAFDLQFSGGRITIHERQGKKCLILRAEPPNGIAVEKLLMKVGSIELEGDEENLVLVGTGTCFTQNIADNWPIGLHFWGSGCWALGSKAVLD